MSTLKKRQHYVWRHYLRPWANNDSIWTYFKELNKVEHPGLMGVGQEKYFYRLIEFTQSEEDFLKMFIAHTSHPTVRDLCLDFLLLFTSHSKLQRQLNESKSEKIDRKLIQDEINKLEMNLMEDTHCKFEGLGMKIIACRSVSDLSFLENEDDFYDTILFLCVQYFRTKGMKNSAQKSFQGMKKERISKFWNILSFTFAMTLARNISLDKKVRVLFFENQTSTKFITCDQPVFNILNDKFDEKGNVSEMELFYPITPKHAISICFSELKVNKYENVLVNEEMVKYFNNKIFNNGGYFIFADNKAQMEALRKVNVL